MSLNTQGNTCGMFGDGFPTGACRGKAIFCLVWNPTQIGTYSVYTYISVVWNFNNHCCSTFTLQIQAIESSRFILWPAQQTGFIQFTVYNLWLLNECAEMRNRGEGFTMSHVRESFPLIFVITSLLSTVTLMPQWFLHSGWLVVLFSPSLSRRVTGRESRSIHFPCV